MGGRKAQRRRGPKPPAWLKGGVRAMAAVSPELAGRAVAPLFFRVPRRLKVREAEAEIFADARRGTLRFEGERLATYAFGDADRTALLVHGWAGRATQLAPFVQPLLRSGWRVLTFDHAGHGESTATGTSLPQMARAIRAVADAEGGVHGFVGHSLGAGSGVLAMHDGLSVRRAAMIASPYSPLPWLARFGDVLGLDDRTLAAARASIERRAGRRLDELDGLAAARTLTTPALIVHDRNDREVSFAAGEALHGAWRGSTLLATEGLGHNRLLADPDVVESVRRFLERD